MSPAYSDGYPREENTAGDCFLEHQAKEKIHNKHVSQQPILQPNGNSTLHWTLKKKSDVFKSSMYV